MLIINDDDILIRFKLPRPLHAFSLALILFIRKLRTSRPYRKIQLSKYHYAIVDAEDYQKVTAYSWHLRKGTTTSYAAHSLTNGKKQKRKNLYMHDLILNTPPGYFADHINHNGLDNRKQNLRAASPANNAQNRRKFSSPSRSKYKGVDFVKSQNAWRARITVNNKRIHLGYFTSEINAAKAYDQAATKHHKNFAYTNFK